MKIEPIKPGDKLYSLNAITWPWRINAWVVLRTMPKHLDIEPADKRRKTTKRIKINQVTGEAEKGHASLRLYFASRTFCLATHRRRARNKIARGQEVVCGGQELLLLLKQLEVDNGS